MIAIDRLSGRLSAFTQIGTAGQHASPDLFWSLPCRT